MHLGGRMIDLTIRRLAAAENTRLLYNVIAKNTLVQRWASGNPELVDAKQTQNVELNVGLTLDQR